MAKYPDLCAWMTYEDFWLQDIPDTFTDEDVDWQRVRAISTKEEYQAAKGLVDRLESLKKDQDAMEEALRKLRKNKQAVVSKIKELWSTLQRRYEGDGK